MLFMFDESADKFVVATTTATDSTGNISHTKADLKCRDKGSTVILHQQVSTVFCNQMMMV